MNRRNFLHAGVAAAVLAPLARSAPVAPPAIAAPLSGRDFYEVRCYRLKTGQSADPLHRFLEHTLLPALADRRLTRVGVFTEMDTKTDSPIWVVIAHPSVESAIGVTANLYSDPSFRQSGSEYWHSTSPDHPAFDRIDSWLSVAFASHPALEIPGTSTNRAERLFELRTYESFSEERALKKIDMFNAGEIPIMREVGFAPVFFGQTLIGRDLPQLTYMLGGVDRASHAAHWKAFQAHPTWMKLKNDPEYANTVSKVVSRFLQPTVYSPI